MNRRGPHQPNESSAKTSNAKAALGPLLVLVLVLLGVGGMVLWRFQANRAPAAPAASTAERAVDPADAGQKSGREAASASQANRGASTTSPAANDHANAQAGDSKKGDARTASSGNSALDSKLHGNIPGDSASGGATAAQTKNGATAPGEAGENVQLDATAVVVIHGSVQGVDGAKLPEAEVAAAAQTSATTAHASNMKTLSDSQGNFTLELSTATPAWLLWARAPGYREAHVQVTPNAAGSNPEVVIQLKPGETLTGSVLSMAGQPVPDAALALHPAAEEESHPFQQRYGLTDAQGFYSISGVTPGTHLLEISAAGFLPARLAVEINAGAPHPIIAKLSPEHVVIATVLDSEGWPLPDAILYSIEPGAASRMVTADSEGVFRFTTGGKQRVSVRAECEGYMRQEQQFPPFEDPENEIEIRLAPARRVHGFVRDRESRAAIADARLQADESNKAREETNTSRTSQAVTRADGSFSIAVLRAGPHELRVAAEGYLTALFPIPEVEAVKDDVQHASDLDAGDLLLDRGGEVTARFADGDGTPIVNVLARLVPANESGAEPRSARSDERGVAIVRGLASGSYRMRATHLEFLTREEDVSISEANRQAPLAVEWKLERGARLTGVVVADANAGVGKLAGRRLDLVGAGTSLNDYLGEDGAFIFTPLPAGTYELTLPGSSGTTLAHESVTLKSGETRTLRIEIK